MRDVTLEDTFRQDFTTRQFSDGVPTTLAGSPVLSVHEEGNDTLITAGVSLDVDVGTSPVAGLNEATIVATAANGYEAGKSYSIFISTGTVGGVSVVGEVVGHFTVELSAAFTRLGAPAGASIAADLVVIDNFVDDLETRLTAARAANLDEVTAVRMATLTDWINGGRLDLLLDAIPTTAMRGTDGALTDKAGFSLSTAGILAVWHQALSAVVTAGSVGKLLKDEITAVRMATLTDWINGGRLDLLLDAIPTTEMRGIDAAALASVATEARLSELDAGTGGKAANQIDLIKTEADKIALADAGAGVAGSVIEEVENRAIPGDAMDLVTDAIDVVSILEADLANAVLTGKSLAELGVAIPSATPTLEAAIMLLYMTLRNKLDVDASFKEVHNNSGSVIAKKALTDDATTYSEAEMVAGP